MVTSGYLDRLGFDYQQADLSHGFRAPDTIARGLAAPAR
jgi:hypothetical protein